MHHNLRAILAVTMWLGVASCDGNDVARPLRVGVMDSQVVYVRADSLIAVAPGRRLLDVELPGQWVFVAVSVSALLVNDTLVLKAGQFRSWALEAGRYTLTVAEVSRVDAVARVQALALRALAERMELGEAVPELLNVEFQAA